MSIITLTTDLGYRDPYLAIVKAKLLASSPLPQLIDLSCDIKENNISDAAFILKNSLAYFPQNSIHLVAVKFIADRSDLSKTNNVDNSRYLVSTYKDQFIILDVTYRLNKEPQFNISYGTYLTYIFLGNGGVHFQRTGDQELCFDFFLLFFR